MIKFFTKMLEILTMPGAFSALVSWKRFSLASFKILSRLVDANMQPSTIIDVGANEGQFSYACCRFFPNAEVHSIEPSNETFIILRNNLKKFRNTNFHQFAIGDYVGDIQFKVNSDSQVSSALDLGVDRRRFFPGSEVLETRSVPITTLDSLFSCKSLAKPILLKIDVQGFEDRVVRGATGFLHNVDWVIVEVSFSQLYDGEAGFQQMLTLMAEHRFEFIRPLNFHTAGERSSIIEMDALFRRIQ